MLSSFLTPLFFFLFFLDFKAKTLILDLDETLIHTCGPKERPMHIIKAKNDLCEDVLVKRRREKG